MRRRAAIAVAVLTLSLLGSPAAAKDVCIMKLPRFGCVEKIVCKTVNGVLPGRISCLR